jgi:hypothetical protein
MRKESGTSSGTDEGLEGVALSADVVGRLAAEGRVAACESRERIGDAWEGERQVNRRSGRRGFPKLERGAPFDSPSVSCRQRWRRKDDQHRSSVDQITQHGTRTSCEGGPRTDRVQRRSSPTSASRSPSSRPAGCRRTRSQPRSGSLRR